MIENISDYEDILQYFASDLEHRLHFFTMEAYKNYLYDLHMEDDASMIYYFQEFKKWRNEIKAALKAIGNVYLCYGNKFKFKSPTTISIEQTYIIPYLMGDLKDIENIAF